MHHRKQRQKILGVCNLGKRQKKKKEKKKRIAFKRSLAFKTRIFLWFLTNEIVPRQNHVFPCEKGAIHNLSFEFLKYIFIILKEEDGTLRE